ncbi:MAG: hypothetical protein EOO03_04375 [Chitinophagaceae bacterium]|nr:MAG: hypothetical protein EOO03_04375 [Chitinophagaceae bacterium]
MRGSAKWKWILATAAVLGIGAVIYLKLRKSEDFEGAIKTRLAKLVHKASEGLYALSIEDIEIDLLGSTITAHNVHLTPDSVRQIVLDKYSKLPDDILTISVRKILIKGISPADLINSKNLSLSQVVIDSPDVLIEHKKRNYNKKDSTSFYDRLTDKNEAYSIGNLLLERIRLTRINKDKNNKQTILYNLTAALDDIDINEKTATDTSRFFFAREALIYAKKYTTVTADKLYRFSIDSIALKPQRGQLEARAVKLEPIDSKDDFSDKQSFKTDRYNIYIEQLAAANVNWWALFADEGVRLDSMNLQGGFVEIYNDSRLPSKGVSKIGKYPHQLIAKAGFPIRLYHLAIDSVDVIYEEFNPKSDTTGRVEFKHITGTLTNVTNLADDIAVNPLMTLQTTSAFMGRGTLTSQLQFDLRNVGNGNFSVYAQLGPMDGNVLNTASKGLGLVAIEDLFVDKLEARLAGDNNQASGTVSFLYHNLKVAALKVDEGKLKKRALLSFLANNFMVKSSNPQKDKPPIVQQVTHAREPNRSFFNLVWKTIADGIIKTAKG